MEVLQGRNKHSPNWTAAQSLNALPVISDAELRAWTEQVLEGSDDSLRRYLLDTDTSTTVCTRPGSPFTSGLLSPNTPAATFNLSQMLSPPPSPVEVSTPLIEEAPSVAKREHLDSTCCADIDTSYEELLNFVGMSDMLLTQPLSPEEVDMSLDLAVEVEEEVVTSSTSSVEMVTSSAPVVELDSPPAIEMDNWRALQQELEFQKGSPESVVELTLAPVPIPSRRKQSLPQFASDSPDSESDSSGGRSSCSSPPVKKVRTSVCGKMRNEVLKERKRLSNRESAARYREKMKALREADERQWAMVEMENQRLRGACRQAKEEEAMLVDLLRQVENLRQRLQVRKPDNISDCFI